MSKFLRWMGLQKPKQEFKLSPEQKEAMQKPVSMGYLNPLWEINVYTSKGEKLISKNLLHIVHTYLKDYGFNPDGQTNPSLIIGLKNSMGEIKMPLFLKKDMGFNPSMEADEARRKGLIL